MNYDEVKRDSDGAAEAMPKSESDEIDFVDLFEAGARIAAIISKLFEQLAVHERLDREIADQQAKLRHLRMKRHML